MQHGQVDMVITGTDRTTASGDVCNKIGTYLKALAARDNGVPFYVALPSRPSTGRCPTGWPRSRSRSATAARSPMCRASCGRTTGDVQISPDGTPGGNPAFDVTPAACHRADHRARNLKFAALKTPRGGLARGI
jgi:methylthioribose-1-phosphate isomerase